MLFPLVHIIKDTDFKRKVENLNSILRVLAPSTDMLQSSQLKIADCVCIMNSLTKKLENIFRKHIDVKQIYNNRLDQMIRISIFRRSSKQF